MQTLATIGFDAPRALLAGYGLALQRVDDGMPIPGSYWGECEAGIIGTTVYARDDTPVHSLLHEACHLIVLPPERRALVHTDATDSVAEEDASCYLQIVLADALPGVGRTRLMGDMDAWGYTFRLGSTQAWFERDADDARQWLVERGLLSAPGFGIRNNEKASSFPRTRESSDVALRRARKSPGPRFRGDDGSLSVSERLAARAIRPLAASAEDV